MVDQPIYIKIFSWFSGLLPAILGSVISLKVTTQDSTFSSRVFSFFAGIVVAHYIGWTIVEYFNIPQESMLSSSILFVVGIFGVSTASEIAKQLPELIRGLTERLIGIISKK